MAVYEASECLPGKHRVFARIWSREHEEPRQLSCVILTLFKEVGDIGYMRLFLHMAKVRRFGVLVCT